MQEMSGSSHMLCVFSVKNKKSVFLFLPSACFLPLFFNIQVKTCFFETYANQLPYSVPLIALPFFTYLLVITFGTLFTALLNSLIYH